MVKFCFARAAECRRNAELATDPARRRSWLNTEGKWFILARSYDSERRPPVKVGHPAALTVVDSLKALDPNRPIREADIA